MDKLLRGLAKALVPVLFPILLDELTKHIESWVKVDLNGDGVVGFGGNGDVGDK